MKWTKNDNWFALSLLILIYLFLWVVSLGCNTTKNVQKTVVDSSTAKDDSIRLLKAERDLFEQQYNELLYASVLFDTIMLHDTITNTVVINKEGEVRAVGKIKYVNISKNIYSSIISQKDRTIDSLKSLKDKVQVITKTDTKLKKVRPAFMWILLLVGYVLGCFYPLIKKK